jgi:conjugal transfer mating pair stabilization protein TraG
MLEIYTIYGGGMWKTALDAVVTLVGQNTFHTLMRIAGTFGVLAVLLTSSNNVTRWFSSSGWRSS